MINFFIFIESYVVIMFFKKLMKGKSKRFFVCKFFLKWVCFISGIEVNIVIVNRIEKLLKVMWRLLVLFYKCFRSFVFWYEYWVNFMLYIDEGIVNISILGNVF